MSHLNYCQQYQTLEMSVSIEVDVVLINNQYSVCKVW